MERFMGIEEARGKLGKIAEEISEGADPVVFAKKGRALAVMVGREEYTRFKTAATKRAREELAARLEDVRARVAGSGVSVDEIDEAIAAVRSLE